MSTTSAKPSARLLDQFYTSRDLVPSLLAHVHNCVQQRHGANACVRWLEPSAGDGAFLDSLPEGALGLDLAPGRADIMTADFLAWSPPKEYTHAKPAPWVVVGNPPFGKNASLAVKFFNHAAQFADLIAFIVPRTFEKISLQNRLNTTFALLEEHAIDPLSFVFEGNTVAVPCVFQVWGRLPHPQRRGKVSRPTTHCDFEMVKDTTQADFAFQRVGAAAGKIKNMNATALAAPSHHFVRVIQRDKVAAVRKVFEGIDFSAVKARTAGNPSIGLTELIELYEQAKANTPVDLGNA